MAKNKDKVYIGLYTDMELKAAVEDVARKDGRSVNKWLEMLIRKELKLEIK